MKYERRIPKDSYIKNIRRGTGSRERFIYGDLYSSKGELLISATLDYILKELNKAEFVNTA